MIQIVRVMNNALMTNVSLLLFQIVLLILIVILVMSVLMEYVKKML